MISPRECERPSAPADRSERRLDGSLVFLRALQEDDTQALADLYLSNRTFLQPFEPRRQDDFFSLDGASGMIAEDRIRWLNDQGYAMGIFELESNGLVGRIALSNIVRRAWQNATIGYFVAEAHNNKGYASEAVMLMLHLAFMTIGLHRVQASVMPGNPASARVLIKAGFRFEGHAPRYLEINGQWEDHDLYAVTAEDWKVVEADKVRP